MQRAKKYKLNKYELKHKSEKSKVENCKLYDQICNLRVKSLELELRAEL